MSIRNLYSQGLKDYQDLNVDSVVAREINAISAVALGLNVQNINVEAPFLEIFVNDDTHFTNDVVIDGSLTVTGDIVNPDIEVNTISTYDTGKVEILDDTILFQSDFKQTDIVGQDSITAPGTFHIQSNGSVNMWLQSDRDNTPESDVPTYWGTQDGGLEGFSIGTNGTSNSLEIIQGNTTDANSGVIELHSKQLIDNGDGLPSWSGSNRLAQFSNGQILFDKSLNMQGNDLRLSGLTSGTSTDILILNGSDIVEVRSQPFGSSVFYAESLALSTSADIVNWVNKITYTDTFEAGDYLVSFSALVGNSTGDRITDLRLMEDAVAINGAPISKPKVDINSAKIPMNMSWRRTLTAGPHTFDLDFRPRANTGEIQDARIIIVRFG